jgi:hypothetical protein
VFNVGSLSRSELSGGADPKMVNQDLTNWLHHAAERRGGFALKLSTVEERREGTFR